MDSRTLKRLVSDTDRGLSQKKEVVTQKAEDISKQGENGNAKLSAVPPTEALKAFFDRIPLQSIPGIENSGVIEVQAGQTMEEALRLLYKHEVLGAPVVDSPLSSELVRPVSDYVGLIEFGSMILWALEEFEVAEPEAQIRGLLVEEDREDNAESSHERNGVAEEAAGVPKATEQGNGDFWSLLSRLENVGSSKVGALARSFRWGPFLPVYPENSLLHILLLLSKHSLKAAPVVDPRENKVTGFITQDAAMQLLLQCSGLSWFDVIAQRQLSEFRFQADQPPGQLIYIHGDKPLIDAFHYLWKYRLTAVPVVDPETNQLIGCVRTADARILLDNEELFKSRRMMTVNEFMEADLPSEDSLEERNRSTVEESIGAAISAAALSLGSFKLPRMQEPVTSSTTDTLEDTIRKLVAARSDRSFMVDENRRLTGVITLRDIIVQFSPPLGEEPHRWGDLFTNAL